MTNMELFLMTGRWNHALIQYNIEHPVHGRAKEIYQLSVRVGGILPRINLVQHAESVDAQLEADANTLDRDIADFTSH